MFPIHTILHPTDFSEQADHAFRMACALARDHNARVVVAHVMPYPPVVYPEGMVLATEDLRPKLTEMLRRVKPDDAKVAVERLLLEGDPTTAILDTAKEKGADLIVMGTHGWRGLTRLLMGSVAEGVLRGAACPVLTVKAPAAPEESTPAKNKTLAPAGV